MLLIGLESSYSPHQCLLGLCFRCSSVPRTFCRVHAPSNSFFVNLHARSPVGDLKQTLRVCPIVGLKINESKQTVLKLFSPKSSGIVRRSRRVPLHSLHRSRISQDL